MVDSNNSEAIKRAALLNLYSLMGQSSLPASRANDRESLPLNTLGLNQSYYPGLPGGAFFPQQSLLEATTNLLSPQYPFMRSPPIQALLSARMSQLLSPYHMAEPDKIANPILTMPQVRPPPCIALNPFE